MSVTCGAGRQTRSAGAACAGPRRHDHRHSSVQPPHGAPAWAGPPLRAAQV